MPQFQAGGRTFNCKDWTVKDLLKFNELQARLDDLGAGTPEFRGAKQMESLKLTIAYISEQTQISQDEIMDWPQALLAEVMKGIVVSNNTLPKALAAEVPSPLSPGLSTQTILPSKEQSPQSTARSS
jgi:hypothetical protein